MNNKSFDTLTSSEKDHFFNYLKHLDDNPAYSNMWSDNWVNENNTLPYILEKTDRFNGVDGAFHIIYDKDNVVACGGVYISSFSTDISIGAVRTWTDEKYRNDSVLREYLFPLHKKWSIDRGMKIMMLTFNDYNKNLIQVFKRRRIGESKERISTREPHHLFYSGLHEIEFPLNIQYTKQWAIYEKFDSDWDFNWQSIKWVDNG